MHDLDEKQRESLRTYLRVQLVDGSEHVIAHHAGVTPKEIVSSILDGQRLPISVNENWLYTTNHEWIRYDAIIRMKLDEEEPGSLIPPDAEPPDAQEEDS